MKDQRMAECVYCHRAVPSDPSLPFFEPRDADSAWATQVCWCGYLLDPGASGFFGAARDEHTHGRYLKMVRTDDGQVVVQNGDVIKTSCLGTGKDPAPRGASATDAYYCGCRGWD